MKFIKIVYPIIAIFLLAAVGSCKPAKKPNQQHVQKNIQLPVKRKAQKPLIVGYNAPGIFYQFKDAKPSNQIIELYKQLDADIIRFPGGTLANHYRFSRPGYGRDLVADKSYDENFIFAFIDLMKAIQTKPRVIYVMNFFEHFGRNPLDENELIEENMNAIKTLRKNGIEVYHIELGNELYIYPEVTNNWLKRKKGLQKMSEDNVIKYLDLAKKYTDLINELDPKIKVGLPMGNFSNPLHRYWNEELLKADFADAYICHFYGNIKKNCNQDACFKESLEQFIRKMTRDILSIKNKTGKEVWVTEWNAINFGFEGDRNLSFAHSDLHVEYNNKFLDIFERSGVEICTYHRISGPEKKPAYNLITIMEDYSCSTNATFEAFKKKP